MNLISIDLETLDTTTTAVILEIGIVVGDDKGNIIEKFRIYPNVSEQLAVGRSVSGDTLLWWMKQDEAIIHEQGKAERLSYADSISKTFSFLRPYLTTGKYVVLGNAPSFDCDILRSFLCDFVPPGGLVMVQSDTELWSFLAERDVRTARMKLGNDERAPNRAKHSALADAEVQYLDFVTFLGK